MKNAQVRKEVVTYYTTWVKAGLREAMMLMKDSIRYPLFDKGELDAEIQVVLDELSRQLSTPFYYLNRSIDDKLWYKYTSRKNPGGSRETVAKATPEMMRAIQGK